MASTEPRVFDHAYDGIQEYDNPMPGWWTFLFWATFLFSVPYFYYYTFGIGERLNDSYDAEVAAFFEVQAKQLGDLKPDEPTMLRLAADAKMMSAGGSLFKGNCATCHAADGGGGTGPNLTDGSYINVKSMPDIHRVIQNGVEAKGMPAWGKRFSGPQLVLLASYVAHLRGTTPAAPKAPQGEPVAPWPTAASLPAPAAAPAAPGAAPAPTAPARN